MTLSITLVDAVCPLHDRVRRSVAGALRDRVAGEDNAARAAVIWDTPGERWFTQADPIWRVHADAAMFVAGIRALLLQSLHPLAMAGVAGHSDYKGDPWGRLQRTSNFLATTTFGTVQDAEALIKRVQGIHERVRGRAPDGRPYAASDPHLLKWVHIAEADSFLQLLDDGVLQFLSAASLFGQDDFDDGIAQLKQAHEHWQTVAAEIRRITGQG
jgi:uncharacterized protein (DUF2236 family)